MEPQSENEGEWGDEEKRSTVELEGRERREIRSRRGSGRRDA